MNVTSHAVVLPGDDIDTDQIIPARFLKGTRKTGLGEHLFADWPAFRRHERGARILVTGHNFGCGSSREHAPWALVDWGFRAVIARSFADIFRQNATKNGLLPVALPEAACVRLELALQANPALPVTVDLASERVSLPDAGWIAFSIDPFAKHCLLNGLDELSYILTFSDRITAHEQR
ncbi:MAG: 3-isopropylmalate dehydratase small subunit [Deltaproteobacteria bacterium]|nr:3-isopropylmalate dehydratase small subunit [Deltaproteobacteria bacterium]